MKICSALLSVLAFGFGGVPLPAVDFVAHRGASHDAPENTLAAEKLAWAQGADAVENDIHLTKDGKLIVIHDNNCRRTTGCEAKIADLTLDEARALDAGSWKSAQFAGEKLPTLDEQLALVPAGKRMLVEIKTGPAIVPELVRTLARAGVDGRHVTLISFHFDSLRALRQQLPEIPLLWLAGYRAPDPTKTAEKKPPTIDEVIAQAKSAGLTGLDLQSSWPLTATEVKKIRAAGLQLHVWTVDDPAVARHWIELGVDSLTTNRPGWLREQLKL